MDYTATCGLTGMTTTLFIPNLPGAMIQDWKGGAMIQDAMPGVSTDHREFILSGFVPGKWDEVFYSEEDVCDRCWGTGIYRNVACGGCNDDQPDEEEV